MPLELIYTSALRGLRAGSSGYCTVARTRSLREDLAAALERRSLYAHEPTDVSPVYFSFRPLVLGGTTWRVLSRAQDAGLDFTGRRHYLVHHLALDPTEEPGGLMPVEILLGWRGWRERWEGSPEELETLSSNWWRDLPRIRLPAREWKRRVGDAGWAAWPDSLTSPVGWLAGELNSPEILQLMAESTALLEERQSGGSWLRPLDAGGAANPVPKDCVWVGRTPWVRGGMPAGLRSILRIEDCRGKAAQGKTEELELCRTGGGRGMKRAGTIPPVRPQPVALKEPVFPRREADGKKNRPRWQHGAVLLVGLGMAMVAGGAWWWQRGESRQPEKAEEAESISPPLLQGPEAAAADPEAVAEIPRSPALALQEMLWAEAGGETPIQVLHLLFDKPASLRFLEAELDLLLQNGSGSGLVRGQGGWSETVSLQEEGSRKNFCREAAQKNRAWSLFVPAASRGLAYLPDPFRENSQRILSVRGQGPQEILEELGKRIFLDPTRWSLLVIFPPWEKQEFMHVRIGTSDPDDLWLDRVDQHRAQMRNLRGEALRQLTPWLGEDPEAWDERKIRQLTNQMRGGKFPEIFGSFRKINEEYRRWWLPPDPGASPERIFAKLLEHPGLRCEIELDGLVMGRLVP